MEILPSNFPQQDPASASASGTRYELQWRKALEEAQWQARQRTSIRLPRQEPAPEASNDSAAREESAGVDVRAPSDAWLGPRASPAADEPGMPTLTRAVVNALCSTVLPGDDPVAGAPATPAAGREPAPAAATAEESATVARFDWKQLPEWPSVVMSATASGSRISIVMRDPTLLDDDALELFYRLRSRLAATGFELAELTINGCSVLPPDSPLAQW